MICVPSIQSTFAHVQEGATRHSFNTQGTQKGIGSLLKPKPGSFRPSDAVPSHEPSDTFTDVSDAPAPSGEAISVIDLSRDNPGEFAGDMHRPEGFHENIGSALALKMSVGEWDKMPLRRLRPGRLQGYGLGHQGRDQHLLRTKRGYVCFGRRHRGAPGYVDRRIKRSKPPKKTFAPQPSKRDCGATPRVRLSSSNAPSEFPFLSLLFASPRQPTSTREPPLTVLWS